MNAALLQPGGSGLWAIGNAAPRLSPAGSTNQGTFTPNSRKATESERFCIYFPAHLTITLPQKMYLLCVILFETLESWIIPQDLPTCFNPWPRECWRIKLSLKRP